MSISDHAKLLNTVHNAIGDLPALLISLGATSESQIREETDKIKTNMQTLINDSLAYERDYADKFKSLNLEVAFIKNIANTTIKNAAKKLSDEQDAYLKLVSAKNADNSKVNELLTTVACLNDRNINDIDTFISLIKIVHPTYKFTDLRNLEETLSTYLYSTVDLDKTIYSLNETKRILEDNVAKCSKGSNEIQALLNRCTLKISEAVSLVKNRYNPNKPGVLDEILMKLTDNLNDVEYMNVSNDDDDDLDEHIQNGDGYETLNSNSQDTPNTPGRNIDALNWAMDYSDTSTTEKNIRYKPYLKTPESKNQTKRNNEPFISRTSGDFLKDNTAKNKKLTKKNLKKMLRQELERQAELEKLKVNIQAEIETTNETQI